MYSLVDESVPCGLVYTGVSCPSGLHEMKLYNEVVVCLVLCTGCAN